MATHVEILKWACEAMELFVENAGRPVSLPEIHVSYPELKRGAMKLRLTSMVGAGWIRETQYGYCLDPAFVQLLHRAQRATTASLGDVVENAKLIINGGTLND